VLNQNVLSSFARGRDVSASSLDQAGGENAPLSGAMFKFRVAKQQPQTSGRHGAKRHGRNRMRRCPPLPRTHARIARGPAPNRWSISSRYREPPAGSPFVDGPGGVLCSLRQHRRLSAVLLRGSLSVLKQSRVDSVAET